MPVGQRSDPAANQKFLNAVYNDLLNRPIDPVGLQQWSNLLASGTPRSTVVEAICSSAEADAKLRGVFVNQLYKTYLGRQADGAGATALWTTLLRGPMRSAIVTLLSSDEYYTRRTT